MKFFIYLTCPGRDAKQTKMKNVIKKEGITITMHVDEGLNVDLQKMMYIKYDNSPEYNQLCYPVPNEKIQGIARIVDQFEYAKTLRTFDQTYEQVTSA